MERALEKQVAEPARPAANEEPARAAAVGTPAYLQRAVDGGASADREPACVGPRDDACEREAERAAATVLSGSREPEPLGATAGPGVRRSARPGVGDAGGSAALDRALHASGAGAPMPEAVRGEIEPVVGRDLSGVRVHEGSTAHAAAEDIGAKAFTRGSDVWLGAGQRSDDLGLMAHEATHVAQQQDGAVRRAPKDAPKPAAEPKAGAGGEDGAGSPATDAVAFRPRQKKLGWLERSPTGKGGTMHLPELKVPFVDDHPKVSEAHPEARAAAGKGRNPCKGPGPWTFQGSTARGSKTARRRWIDEGRTELAPGIKKKLEKLLAAAGGSQVADGKGAKEDLVGLEVKRSPMHFVLLGSVDQLSGIAPGADDSTSGQLLIPVWSKRGKRTFFHVDHAQELQLGGLDGWQNFWLWEGRANTDSGRKIHSQMVEQVGELTKAAVREGFWSEGGSKRKRGKQGKGKSGAKGAGEEKAAPEPAPTFEEVRGAWTIQYAKLAPLAIGGEPQTFWSRAEIAAGEHLDQLEVLGPKKLVELGVGAKGGEPKQLRIFTEPTGGMYKLIPWSSKGGSGDTKRMHLPTLYGGFDVTAVTYDVSKQGTAGAEVGCLHGVPFRIKRRQLFAGKEELKIPLLAAPALGFGGYIDQKAVRELIQGVEIRGASPIAVDFAGIDTTGDLAFEGRILATKKLMPGLEIPISVVGTTVTVDFPIPTEKLSLGPVAITQAHLRIFYGSDGLEFGGGIDFAISGLGRGSLTARGLDFEGAFELELSAFDPARVEVAYKDDAWSGGATLGVKEGALPGVESGQVEVGIGPEGPTVDGALTLGVGPFRGIRLVATYDRERGLSIGAEDIALPVAKIPGVESATASVHVRRSPKGEWSVAGAGSAAFGVEGVGGTLSIALDGDRITIAGTGKLERGFITGVASFVVTNAPLDDEGRASEGEPTDELVASGSGMATIAFGKLLRGSVGLEVLPNGEVVLKGEIALPPEVPVFEPWKVRRELFRPPPLDIPLLGISAAGHRIGIFATINGGINFDAQVGPGKLVDTKVGIEFNPDRQEDTKITGTTGFVIPASAGLELFVRGGLGVGIPIVSAEAGLKVSAFMGVAAESRNEVQLEWTPQKGLVVDALAKLEASPKFRFAVSAYVDVDLDLWLKTIDIYDDEWTLADFEYGPSLAFGIEAPLRWSEEGGLEFSFEAIRIKRPELDLKRTATDLVKEVVG